MKTSTKLIKQIAQHLFAIFLTCFSFLSVFGQGSEAGSSLFTIISDLEVAKLKSEKADKYSNIKNSKVYKDIFPVKLGKLPRVQKKGILAFKIPGASNVPAFIANKVDAVDENNFTWYGTSKDGTNTALFVCTEGKLGGSFNVGPRNFQLQTLEGDVGVIMEGADIFSELCAAQGSKVSDEALSQPKLELPENQNARAGVCTEPLRVLVLYTQAASNNTFDIVSTTAVAAAQYNQAIDNVGRSIPQTNKITVAAIVPITFTSNNPESTSNAEQGAEWVNSNSTVQALRNTHNADLVVCMIYKVQDYAGWAVEIPANNARFAATVGVQYASTTGGYTFAHELGHLLGGRHHQSADPNGPQYSHGYSFTGTNAAQYRTIMHTGGTGTRILYFSAPNINYAGVPVGTYSDNDVARRISEVSTSVVNLRPSTTQPFNAAIIGPTSISSAGNYSWELYTFCRNFLTTTWQFSTDGFNYGPMVGFGDIVSNYYIDGNNNGNLYLRCTILTDQNQTYVTTTTINVNICPGCKFVPTNEVPDGKEVQTSIDGVFPNPASNKLAIDFTLKSGGDVTFELVNMIGKQVITTRLGHLPSGKHQHEANVNNLPSGLYISKMSLDGQVFTKSIVVAND